MGRWAFAHGLMGTDFLSERNGNGSHGDNAWGVFFIAKAMYRTLLEGMWPRGEGDHIYKDKP